MNYKKIMASILLSTTIFGATSTMSAHAATVKETSNISSSTENTASITELLNQYKVVVYKLVTTDTDGNFVGIKPTATSSDLKEASMVQWEILKEYNNLSSDQKKLFDSLSTLKKRYIDVTDDNNNIQKIQNKLKALYQDSAETQLREGITEQQVLDVFTDFEQFNTHTHDPSSQTAIQALQGKVEGTVDLWTNRTAKQAEGLFTDSTHTQLASQVTRGIIEEVSKNVDGLSKLNVKPAIIQSLQLDIQQAYSLLETSSEVNISDANLKKALNEKLGKPATATITKTELASITSLNLNKKNISNLDGLQYCTNLQDLQAGWNTFSSQSLEYIKALPLHSLNVQSNHNIADLSALSTMTSLTSLEVWDCQVSNLEPVKNLTNLTYLGIGVNPYSDISPLSQLTELRGLVIAHTPTVNLSPVSNLTKLTKLWADNMPNVTDVTALSHLVNLQSLHIYNDSIKDFSPLNGLPNITDLLK